MSAIKIAASALFILTGSLLFAQSDQFFTDPAGQRSSYSTLEKIISQENLKDYKIIGSNSSFIELEFTPAQLTVKKIQFNTETFEEYDFDNASSYDPKLAGDPNLKHRAFSVSLPSEFRNTVQVTDYDVKEFRNVNLAPYPFVNYNNRGIRGFESIVYSFIKGSKYSENKFLPENIASLESIGIVRDLTTGRLNITPLQYNPVTGVLKIYTRVRVRISFGSAPVMYNRPRTKQEINLLKGFTINSDLGLNWINPKYATRSIMPPAPSVLSTGDWYKIDIKDDDEGNSNRIYKITKNVLEAAGINLTGIDPRKMKIYGNGGDYLNENFNISRPGDLQEIAINFVGEADGSFDANDYILFYGKSINNWRYDTAATTGFYSHIINVYSKSNYYWLCLNTPENGKRMAPEASSGNPVQYTPGTFTEKVFREKEQVNLLNEGNLWLEGPKRNGQSFEWPVTLKGLESGSEILYKIKPASRCLRPPDGNINYMLIKDEYSSMPEIRFDMGYVTTGFGDWIWTASTSFTINQSIKTNGEQVKFRSTYMSNAPEADGYIDWWEIIYQRRLNSASGDYLSFDSPDVTGTVEYNVSSFSGNDIKVFDVTDHNNVKLIQPNNVTASNVKFRKDESRGNMSRFFVVGPGGYQLVGQTWISGKINNQNIRGITDGASLVIITHRDLLQAAGRVKTKREAGGPSDPGYLKTFIVTTDQIYNEFSGGVVDVTAIRDFLKHAYDNWSERPAYVLLLGDGHFDYKNIYTPPITNYVPAFEITHPSINQVDGYTTDDYYVSVVGGLIPSDPPDMSVGRIPANSEQEASDYLDKVDCYESGQSNGYWKNKMVFVADDQMTSDGCEGVFHLAQQEELAEYHTPPTIDKVKIYMATYPTVITPQGRRKPQVNADIIKYWNDGAIDIAYAGHGSPDVWAHEYVLEKDNVMSQLHNECRYPLVTIASCDMSKFDNPISQSAGELFMIQPRKGAIGTFAATRPVYAEGNATIMRRFFDNLYLVRDTLLLQQRMGKALFLTKQGLFAPNDLKYVLMGDPTLRIQIPRYRSRVDSIAGLSNDTMRALSRIKIYGSIIKPDSSFWNNFNGSILLKVYDVDRQITLVDPDCPQFTHSFRLNGGIIFAGQEGINNGNWVAEFIVPKDISYRNNQGKLIDYFYNTQADGSGIYRDFYVGGIDPGAPVDTTGPNISLYLNTRNFRTGDIVNKNFKLIADLFDESGINTTGTIGHKIEAIIDNNENNKYDLTNFYNSDTSYQSGSLEYDFLDFQETKHILRLKAWDTYNNSSEREIEFTVSDGTALKLSNVYNYPNPFSTTTTFTFQHNFPNAIDVKIKIYTVAGRLIKEISQNQIPDKFVSLPWSGMDEDGETLGNGVYIYKIVVEAADGQSVTEIGKLAVLK